MKGILITAGVLAMFAGAILTLGLATPKVVTAVVPAKESTVKLFSGTVGGVLVFTVVVLGVVSLVLFLRERKRKERIVTNARM